MPDIIKEAANEELKKMIESRGLKQKYVANKIGVTNSYLSSILSGRLKMSVEVAVRAARALGEPADIFLKKS